jgi:hypothetical protein
MKRYYSVLQLGGGGKCRSRSTIVLVLVCSTRTTSSSTTCSSTTCSSTNVVLLFNNNFILEIEAFLLLLITRAFEKNRKTFF